MIPRSILSKMSAGLGVTLLTLATQGWAEENKKPVNTLCCVPQPPWALTNDQLAQVKKLIPDLESKDSAVQEKAEVAIGSFGMGAISPLKEVENLTTNADLRERIRKLVNKIIKQENECAKCGKG